jgi:hypothetical protein
MSHETPVRPDGLDDELRHRLDHLARTDTGDTVPWPGVDDAIRRRRRTRAGVGAALGTAAAVVAGVVLAQSLGAGPTAGPPVGPPAGDGGTTWTEPLSDQPPWPVPAAPYRQVYENVAVDVPTGAEACDATFVVDLHDPARVVRGPYDPQREGAIAFSVQCQGGQETGSNLTWGVPTAIPQGPATTAEDCATAFRTSPEISSPGTPGSVMCLLAEPDPARDRPLMIVRLEHTVDSSMLMGLGFKVTAWTGGEPTVDGGLPQLNPPEPKQAAPERPDELVSAPFRTAYEDVPLRLPGKPGGCDDESFLDLHVPEVNDRLAPSDAMQTPPCGGDTLSELQARGVVLGDGDVTAERCAAALAGEEPMTERFTAAEGSTFCLVSASRDDGTPAKLVALTVTEVDERTGAFDLSATAWDGTVTKN